MRASLVAVLVAFAAAECERTPPEDFTSRPIPTAAPVSSAAPAATPTASATTTAVSHRCIRATPALPPAPVPSGPAPACPVDPEGGPPKLPVVRVAFPDAGDLAVDAEMARSTRETTRGLMYRKAMPEEHAMLFWMRTREDHQFWMHNTCIPLDMLFIDDDGLVVGIVENAPTLDDDSRGVGCPSLWVLEVNAGWARRHGVKAGQHARIPPEATPR